MHNRKIGLDLINSDKVGSEPDYSMAGLAQIVIVISKCLKRHLKAKRTRAPAYSRALRLIKGELSKRVIKRSSGPISRIPGGDRVAVKVDVVQIERVNDQMGQGKSA